MNLALLIKRSIRLSQKARKLNRALVQFILYPGLTTRLEVSVAATEAAKAAKRFLELIEGIADDDVRIPK